MTYSEQRRTAPLASTPQALPFLPLIGLRAPREGLFAGLLSLLDTSGDVSGIEGRPVVDAYTRAWGEGNAGLSARNIGKGQTASLYGLAL
jgi:hypothetical protein